MSAARLQGTRAGGGGCTHISLTTMENGERPGFTTDTFNHSLPRSTAMMAPCERPRLARTHSAKIVFQLLYNHDAVSYSTVAGPC